MAQGRRRGGDTRTTATIVASPSSPSSSLPPPFPCLFNRDNLSRLFLRVSVQLEALQPTRPLVLQDNEQNDSAPASSQSLRLPSRARIHEILQKNQRFRPVDELRRRHDDVENAAPTSPVHNRYSSTAQDPSPSTTSAHHTKRIQVFAAVGGRARVFPASELARAKLVLRKRSLALTNLHAPDPLSVLRDAPIGTLELFRSSSSINVMADKHALVTELVQHTQFTTQHIFQMSRKFKEIAGNAKSLISFVEFRQMMSDDIGVLLQSVGVTPEPGEPPIEPVVTMSAISAAIANCDSFLRRLFQMFDQDGDGKIDFREFVMGLNGFFRSTLEDKVAALFDVYGNYSSVDSPTTEQGSTVAISNILGLFQGDRQVYQELMRCVDEYFVRTELHDEGSISQEEFVTASVSAPRLLETITRPTPSQRYTADPRLRDMLRCYADHKQVTWRKMLEIQRRIFSVRAQATALGGNSGISVTEADASLPLVQFHQILVECCAGIQRLHSIEESTVNDASSKPHDFGEDSTSQQILRAYVTLPPMVAARVDYSEIKTSVDTLVDQPASVPHIAHTELMQDLAVVLHAMLPPEMDSDSKARYYFEWFDSNHDGILSRSELVTAVCAGFAHFGQHVTEVVRILEDEDQDQDGELTKQEYMHAAARSPLIFTSLYTCFPQEIPSTDIHTRAKD